jgi:hypothetical protein
MAEREGFEPPVPCGTSVFKTDALDQTMRPLLVSAYYRLTRARYTRLAFVFRNASSKISKQLTAWFRNFLEHQATGVIITL